MVLAFPPGSSGAEKSGSIYLTGKFLVAKPKMADPRFVESVIYMVKHDREGAMGLIVNRLIGSGPMASFLEGFEIEAQGVSGEARLNYGGPVNTGSLLVLHSVDYEGPGTTFLGGHLALTVRSSVLKAIARGAGPKDHLFVFGYAGWGAGQLESEMARDDWTTAPADKALIFADDPDKTWEKATARSGLPL
ncbi:MAG: YqgE/AlgH family protein [Rhodospirillales bacterium]